MGASYAVCTTYHFRKNLFFGVFEMKDIFVNPLSSSKLSSTDSLTWKEKFVTMVSYYNNCMHTMYSHTCTYTPDRWHEYSYMGSHR